MANPKTTARAASRRQREASHRQSEASRQQRETLIYSPNPVSTAGFRSLLDRAGGYRIFECSQPAELRERISRKKPALLIVDAAAGVTLDFLAGLRTLAPGTAVVLWLGSSSTEFVRQAVALGVLGVLSRDASLEACAECVGQAAEGRLWLEEELSRKLLCARTVRLTRREGELIGLLTQGLKNKEIAWRMKITEGTAKAYLTRLYRKTGANDRFDLALYAIRHLTAGPAGDAPGFALYDSGADGAAPAPCSQFRPASLAGMKPSGA